jgi:hypothetical protein
MYRGCSEIWAWTPLDSHLKKINSLARIRVEQNLSSTELGLYDIINEFKPELAQASNELGLKTFYSSARIDTLVNELVLKS